MVAPGGWLLGSNAPCSRASNSFDRREETTVLALVVYSLTLFVSAFLLFAVQPMYAKVVLPFLGGTPAVWNTCMVFFQAFLLLGYAYSHVSTQWLGGRRQSLLHIIVLALPLIVLPVALPSGGPASELWPAYWLLILLTTAVGLPFFVISTSNPLLQHWFASCGGKAAKDPYILYAASNLGSLAALISYPWWIEPNFSVTRQLYVWSIGYGMLIAFTLLCMLLYWKSPRVATVGLSANAPTTLTEPLRNEGWTDQDEKAPPLDRRTELLWIGLGFVPSSLMLGLTTFITTELGAIPLLWIVPLTIYLLTFIVVFAVPNWNLGYWFSKAMPWVLLPAVFTSLSAMKWSISVFHLIAFIVVAMACHGRLAALRPDVKHLTRFYMAMSLGGVLGGIFNSLVAPLVFKGIWEYPLVLCLAVLFREIRHPARRVPASRWLDLLIPVLGLEISWGVKTLMKPWGETWGLWVGVAVMSIYCMVWSRHRYRFFLCLLVPIAGEILWGISRPTILHVERSFFGVLKVSEDAFGTEHVLTHGATFHGFQSLDPAKQCQTNGYYDPTGPIVQVFSRLQPRAGESQKVAILGLGTGTLVCLKAPGRRFTYYEIDPIVLRIASDPRYFTYLSDCGKGTYDVVLGDGRLKISEAADEAYDLMVFDAFSSDAIPTHLLTRQAVEIYLRKLKPDGVMLFHISNRYLDLKTPLGKVAESLGLKVLVRVDSEVDFKTGKFATVCLVMARNTEAFRGLDRDPDAPWTPPEIPANTKVWTDESSDLLSILRW